MSLITTEVQDRSGQTSITNSGFRPQLFIAAAGSYASNAVFGSGVVAVDNYDDETLRGDSSSLQQSKASVRQQDKLVDFELALTLDLDAADPGFAAADELRFGVVAPLLAGQPARYLNGLPDSDWQYGLPLVLDVEAVQVSTGLPPAGFPAVAGVGQLQARLLHGGQLALVVADLAAGPPPVTTPLTAGDLIPLWAGALGAGERLRISVRGSYRGNRA